MKSPRIIVSITPEALEKLQRIANKKGLSVSALGRMYLLEKLENIQEDKIT